MLDITAAAANNRDTGLTSDEVLRRRATFGPNSIPDSTPEPILTFLGKFWAPVPCLLEAAIALQLFIGEYVEASIIACLLVFNAAIGFIHERRAQATIEALKSKLALNAAVRRDRCWQTVPAADLVPGDIIKLSLGSIVAADARILDGSVLLDHSMLTGESLPIEGGAGHDTYAGALVRRGEAVAEVTATGKRTKFGRGAELVRTAYVESSQQKAVLRVVRNLAGFNGLATIALLAYAYEIGMPIPEFVPLVLITVLASVPVALPATFTLATALGAQALTRAGVLPTRLSAVDEAASMDVLCADKTGTLTLNALRATITVPMPGFSEAEVLGLAALASSEGGLDSVDAAVRSAARGKSTVNLPRLVQFTPFDPTAKMSEARAADSTGAMLRIVKGAFAIVNGLCAPSPAASAEAEKLERNGFRVLGVAIGAIAPLRLAGLIALSDPPRPEAKECIDALHRLGVRTLMVTGDAPATAAIVAAAVGIEGAVCSASSISGNKGINQFGVFAGVLPEDKFRLVERLQVAGHIVGMCGDGANDSPALSQAQIGIAVSTATDAAKSAAGIVLTEPGLSGILAAVREGRITFQRILTYTLRSIVHKTRQVLFLGAGLVMTGHAILTPMLMVLSMMTGDFLAMSSTTDNVRPSPLPNTWRIDSLTVAGIALGICDLIFCAAVLAIGRFSLHFDIERLRTLTLVTLTFSGQAIFYVVRERQRIWSSRPSLVVILCSIADMLIIPTLAIGGILMTPLVPAVVAAIFAASLVLAVLLDQVKVALFACLKMV